MKRWKKLLVSLLTVSMTIGASTMSVMAADGYTYKVTLSAGNKGTINGQTKVEQDSLVAGSTVTFNPSAAVAYAKGHSETTENALCSNRNTSFGSSTNNDCANFVSQCLVAGGLPMFDGWCYKVSGIPSSWNTGGWTWTYSGYQALNRKGRVSAVALSNVKPGDFIYNYDPSQPAGKQYTHAMLAVSTYKNGGVDICGHTRNQNTVFKSFNSSNCKCYRVNPTITIGPDEKRVTLPATGSGATVH